MDDCWKNDADAFRSFSLLAAFAFDDDEADWLLIGTIFGGAFDWKEHERKLREK